MKTKSSRLLSLCLTGLFLSLSAFGCQEQAESGPMHRLTELSLDSSYEDPSAPREATITFEGVTYTGTYDKTEAYNGVQFPRHLYRIADKSVPVSSFSLDASTGELRELNTRVTEHEVVISDMETMRARADAIAAGFVDLNDERREIIVEESEGSSGFVSFEYKIFINGYETTDVCTVMLYKWNKNRVAVSTGMPGAFADTADVEVDEQKLTEAAEAKVNEIYGGVREIESWESRYKTLTKTEDGKTALHFVVDVRYKVHFSGESGLEEAWSGELKTFLVPLEE